MKAERPGTHRRRRQLYRKHYELMQKYIAEGMSIDSASRRAYDEITGRVSAPVQKSER